VEPFVAPLLRRAAAGELRLVDAAGGRVVTRQAVRPFPTSHLTSLIGGVE
jgi:hypothetical protein